MVKLLTPLNLSRFVAAPVVMIVRAMTEGLIRIVYGGARLSSCAGAFKAIAPVSINRSEVILIVRFWVKTAEFSALNKPAASLFVSEVYVSPEPTLTDAGNPEMIK